MAINPNIALAVKGIELQDPLAQYGKIATIQNAQQQNALAQLQMQEKQLEQEQTNALNRAYAEAYNPSTGEVDANKLRKSLATGGFGSKLPEVEKKISELKTQQLAQQKAQTDLVDSKLKQSRAFLENINPMDPNAPAQYIAWHEANHKDPVLGEMLASRGITAEQSRARIEQAIAQGPAAFAELLNQSKLGTEKFMEMNKPTTQVVDQSGQRQVIQIPGLGGTPTTVGTYADIPLPDAVVEQRKAIARAGAPVMPAQEKAFETKIGELQAKDVLDSKTAAEDAVQILETNEAGRQILKSGAITGTGADFFVGFNNALKQIGIDAGYADAAANAQAYAAAMAANTAKLIKQFGAGTGLSDADREYALKAAAGDITMTEAAIRKILDINDRAANKVIDRHNAKVKNIKSVIPLSVDKPVFAKPQSAASQIPGQSAPTRATTPSRTVVRTGTINGRRVNEYSDGSVDYAD